MLRPERRRRAAFAWLARTVILAALCGLLPSAPVRGDEPLAIGAKLDLVSRASPLHDVRYEPRSLGDLLDAELTVLVFLDSSCAAVASITPALRALHEEFAARGVRILGVHANDRESLVEAAAFAGEHELHFPILKDVWQSTKGALGVTRTPEAVVFDAEGTLRYRGAVLGTLEDVDGVEKHAEPLRDAMLALLEGRPVPVAEAPASGCLIRQPRPIRGTGLTWSKHAEPIFAARCVHCHRADGATPFAISSLGDVRAHREEIARAVDIGRMPPAPRDPRVGSFSAHDPLSAKERVTLLGWLAEGDIDRAEDTVILDARGLETGTRETGARETGEETVRAATLLSVRAEGEMVRARFALEWSRAGERLVDRMTLLPPRAWKGLRRAELRSVPEGSLAVESASGALLALWGTGETSLRCDRDAPIEIPRDGALVLELWFGEDTPTARFASILGSESSCSLRVGRAPSTARRRTVIQEISISSKLPSARWSAADGARLRAIAALGDGTLRTIALDSNAEAEVRGLFSLPSFDARWTLLHPLPGEGLSLAAGARLVASGRFEGAGAARLVLVLETASSGPASSGTAE